MTPTNGSTDPREGDERIKAVLRQATELANEVDPLFTWEELCEIVAECRLELLERHPRLEDLYTTTFNPLIKSLYGSTESYLRTQLGWGREPEKKEEEEREYWTRGGVTNVRRNDWPYAVPKDVRHYVVWVPLPLFHPALCTPRPTNLLDLPPSPSQSGTSTPSGSSRTNPLAKPFAPPLPHEPSICSSLSPSVSRVGRASVAPTKGSWDFVCRNGLGGLTGRAEEWWRVRRREKERQRGVQDDGGMGAGENDQQGARRSEEYDEKQGPEKEIRAFVLKKWRVEDGWETAWFANPPGLQSVPGLAHFHVLARRHPVTNGTSE
ncbi:hypothetical protein NBRC10512_001610 [Rhodotorula toruloides]|uniref:RHTO0S12e04654g1_1 n=2 Tax=Rhodotorula toruloides TaxID=5286 RepID=A0A061B961_RHOTO|nr:protein of unknown function DUF3605 [Rhodotorula toruloides NP11]EMS23133.1 protein of unknown function DUF3605 [Rhodotorula toruloides NP11]CDR46455.1 RHTO0S12e04654g1_1 [Rhodotorula toruloides]